MSPGVDHQRGGTVGHIEVHVEVLVDALQHLHGLTGREDTRTVGVDGVAGHLLQTGTVTVVIVLQRHQFIVDDVGRGQVHILAHGQVQGVTGLVGIHDMLVVLQTGRVALRVVERQIDIVGEVGEDIAQLGTQRLGDVQVGLRGELRLQLGGHVRHQAQLIVHLRLLDAVAQVLVDHRTTHRRQQGEQQAICLHVSVHQHFLSLWIIDQVRYQGM